MTLQVKMSIDTVRDFWNNRPCNIKHSTKPIGSKEYFAEVRSKKMFVEPHILGFADFSKYKGKRVLEVGCGIGTAAYYFCDAGVSEYVGIDLSFNSVVLCKQHLEYCYGGNEDENQEQIRSVFEWNIEEDLTALHPEYLNHFDLIYSFGVLHHTPNIEKCLGNIQKLLTFDGDFKLMLYAKNSWKNFMINGELDQPEAQFGCPIANTYTKEDVIELLISNGFYNVRIQQDHIFKYKVDLYVRGIYEEEDWFGVMSQKMKDILDKNLGWHLCIDCTPNKIYLV